MDWKDVAAKVVSLGAPMLGSALGGPLGGMAGKVLADAFGAAASTPEAVHAAISDKAADLKARRGGCAKSRKRMDVRARRNRQEAGERNRRDDAGGSHERRHAATVVASALCARIVADRMSGLRAHG